MQWRPLHYKNLLKSHAAFHVYGEHMGKPAIFRPQNKPLCSWTHDRTGSFLLREPRPRGVGPLTVIKPPQFSQQNRSYIKLKHRGLINKVWAGEKRNLVNDSHNDLQTVFPPRSWAVQSHEIHFKTWSRCLPRQKKKKKHSERKRPWLQRFSSNIKPGWQLLHNAVGWTYVCLVFLQSLLRIQMQRLCFHKETKIRKLTIIWNSSSLWKRQKGDVDFSENFTFNLIWETKTRLWCRKSFRSETTVNEKTTNR